MKCCDFIAILKLLIKMMGKKDISFSIHVTRCQQYVMLTFVSSLKQL